MKVAKKLVKVKIRKPLGYVMAGNYGKELRWQACRLSGCQSAFSTLDERKTQMIAEMIQHLSISAYRGQYRATLLSFTCAAPSIVSHR